MKQAPIILSERAERKALADLHAAAPAQLCRQLGL